MQIAIIGAGNVGGTLAKRFAEAGHTIFLGVRNPEDAKVKALLSNKISVHSISAAAKKADVIVMAVNPQATKEVAKQLGDVSKKIIIDTMNTFRGKPDPYNLTAEALLAWTNCKAIVRCFNTTGFENMANPNYAGYKIDAYVAGDSQPGKKVAIKLAKQIGFGEVYDLGGNDKFELMEQIVVVWLNLAKIIGRDIALNIRKR